MRLRVDGDHRVRDVRVDPPEPFEGCVDEPLDLRAVRDIRLEREVDVCGVESLTRACPDDDARSSCLGALGDRPPEAVRASADHHDLLRKRFFPGHRRRLSPYWPSKPL